MRRWNEAEYDLLFRLHPPNQPHAPDLGPLGFTQFGPAGPAPCNPYAQMLAGLNTAGDGSVVAIYQLAVAKKAAKNVSLNYKGM